MEAEEQHLGRGARLTLRITHYLHGYAAQKLGQQEKAIERYRQALRYQPPYFSHDAMEDCLANAYLAFGRYTEAASEYERVLRFNSNHALARIRLARAYTALGRRGDADREYRQFLAVWANADPDVPEVVEARRNFTN
jgi:tetratricopeptide (TPR) repeat protein